MTLVVLAVQWKTSIRRVCYIYYPSLAHLSFGDVLLSAWIEKDIKSTSWTWTSALITDLVAAVVQLISLSLIASQRKRRDAKVRLRCLPGEMLRQGIPVSGMCLIPGGISGILCPLLFLLATLRTFPTPQADSYEISILFREWGCLIWVHEFLQESLPSNLNR